MIDLPQPAHVVDIPSVLACTPQNDFLAIQGIDRCPPGNALASCISPELPGERPPIHLLLQLSEALASSPLIRWGVRELQRDPLLPPQRGVLLVRELGKQVQVPAVDVDRCHSEYEKYGFG